MKYIAITPTFKKQLKKFRRYISEQDIVNDVKKFAQVGLTKGEAKLKQYTVYEIEIEMVKLRICVLQVDFRYLIGIIEDEYFLPIVIDLKKGRYGENLGLEGSKKTKKIVENLINSVIAEFIENSHIIENNPVVSFYPLD